MFIAQILLIRTLNHQKTVKHMYNYNLIVFPIIIKHIPLCTPLLYKALLRSFKITIIIIMNYYSFN